MKRICSLMIVIGIMFMSFTAIAQGLPTDRERNGLKGRVRSVKELDTENKYKYDSVWNPHDTFRIDYSITTVLSDHIFSPKDTIVDTISNAEFRWIVKSVFPKKNTKINIDNVMSGKAKKRLKRKLKRKYDIIEIDTVHIHYCDSIRKEKRTPLVDTIYYSYVEYTPEGWEKYRKLVKKNGNVNEESVTTFDGERKLEMRTYSKVTGITTLWNYYYSDYEKDPRLSAITIIEYNEGGEGKLKERVTYEYKNNGETCYEWHFGPDGKELRKRHYESGLLIDDINYVTDTILHHLYDDGILFSTDASDASFNPLYSEQYEYLNGYYQRTTYVNRKDGEGKNISTTKKEEKLDPHGNWISCEVNRERKTERDLKYYNDKKR